MPFGMGTENFFSEQVQFTPYNLLSGFVGVVHVAGIVLVLAHVIGPIQAAAIHLLPDFLVFLNSTKLLKVKIP